MMIYEERFCQGEKSLKPRTENVFCTQKLQNKQIHIAEHTHIHPHT